MASPRWLQKSWLFEIVDKESNVVDESFTLIFPPQSVDIRESQRVSITKTFGNAIVDDYGPDNLEITIKAISGTTHVFPTFTTKGEQAPFDSGRVERFGQRATQTELGEPVYDAVSSFYTFRNKIMRYKENFDPYSAKELRVYDLGDQQAYRCILLEFNLSRTADQPLRYPFTLSLFVYDKMDSAEFKREQIKKQVIQTGRDQRQALLEARSLLEQARELYAGVNNVLNKIHAVIAQVDLALTQVASGVQQVAGLVQGVAELTATPLDLSKRLAVLTESAIASVRDAYLAGRSTFNQYMNAKSILNQQWRNVIEVFNTEIERGAQSAKTVGKPIDTGVNAAGAQQTEIQTYNYSGSRAYRVRANDTLQTIAQQELNDEDLWYYIAQTNGITSNADLSAGQEIIIPVQIDQNSALNDAFIITENPLRNPYGTDIALSSTGELLLNDQGNDFQSKSGIENVKQAVDIKFTTPIGTMIKQTAFGLSAQIGSAGDELALAYLQMSMKSTLLLDPRIVEVNNLVISIDGGTIAATMDLGIVGREEVLPVSVNL
jgi:hypothetical protein